MWQEASDSGFPPQGFTALMQDLQGNGFFEAAGAMEDCPVDSAGASRSEEVAE